MLQELAEEQMQRAAAAKAAAAASPRDHVDVDHVRRELAQVQTTLHAAQKVRCCCGCYVGGGGGSYRVHNIPCGISCYYLYEPVVEDSEEHLYT